MKKLICTFIYLFILIINASHSLLAEQIVFRQISLEQGLSQSKVVAILRDHEGYLWAGTEDGINRISQSGIKTYHFDYADSLRGNFIFFIEEDYKQNLWIGTDKGLLIYNRSTDKFDPSDYSKYNYTACLSEKDQIIFKAYDHLLIVNDSGSRYIKFENNKLFSSSCKMLRKDANHLILTGYWQGIYELNLSNGILRGLPINAISACTSVTKDNQNRYWIGFYGDGVKCLDSNFNIYREFDFRNSASVNDNLVMDIISDSRDQIWVVTDGGGLKIINSNNFDVQNFAHVQGVKNSIPVNNLLNIYFDRTSGWIGSVSGGLISIDKPIIQSFQEANPNTPYGLSHNIVTSFAKSDSLVWIGTDGNGINNYNTHNHTFKHFPNTFKLSITSMIDWDKDRLIVVLYNLGIYYFNKRTGNIEPIQGLDKINRNIQHTQVSPGIYKLDDNSIFIASTHCYIYNFTGKQIYNLSEKCGFKHYPSLRLAGIKNETLFLYDSNKIMYFDKRRKFLKKIAEFNTTKVGSISSMTLLSDNELWFVTRTGLYCYDLNKKSTTKNKLPGIFNPTLISSLSDNQLVIGTKDKIVYYEPKKNNIQFFDSSNGLLVNEYSRRACLVDTIDSLLVIGGVNGISVMPTHINNTKDDLKKNILLTSIYVNGERKAYQAKTSNPIKLSAGVSKLEFQLNIMDANLFKSPVFRYRLKGYDKEFKSSSHYILDYYNLDPGNYSLEVQYQLSNGHWSDFVTLSHITILPHWWDSWIFKLLITLIFVASIFAYYYKNKNDQERKLEQRIRNYEKEMYQKKIQFFESINHELRTPLTLITGPINRLIHKDKTLSNEAIFTLQKVSNQTDYMKHVINMVLDIRKLDQGITDINYKLTDLVEFIDNIRVDFSDSYDQKGVLLSFQQTLSNEMIWIDQLKIKIILVNLLSNALKFSEPKSHVSIVLSELDNNIKICVNDEGTGLKEDDLDNLFNSYYQGKHNKDGNGIGLYYSRMLINLIGGEIKATNNISGGATFTVLIPRNLSVEDSDHSHQEYYVKPEIEDNDPISSENFTILLVEDIPDMQFYLAEELRSAFNQVIVAGNGKDASEILKSHKIDLVVSDIMMPIMNGYELCSVIKKDIELSHIPVILLTALCEDHNIKIGYNCGANAYLAKPFDSEVLINLIQTLRRQEILLKKRFKADSFAIVPEELIHSNLDKVFIDKLLSLINEHIEQPELDVDFICDKMAVSRSALYSKMKSYIGKGVKELINDIRIEKAKNLLKQTDLPISEISFQVGFAQQRYFSRVFKSEVGMTPSEYRTNKS